MLTGRRSDCRLQDGPAPRRTSHARVARPVPQRVRLSIPATSDPTVSMSPVRSAARAPIKRHSRLGSNHPCSRRTSASGRQPPPECGFAPCPRRTGTCLDESCKSRPPGPPLADKLTMRRTGPEPETTKSPSAKLSGSTAVWPQPGRAESTGCLQRRHADLDLPPSFREQPRGQQQLGSIDRWRRSAQPSLGEVARLGHNGVTQRGRRLGERTHTRGCAGPGCRDLTFEQAVEVQRLVESVSARASSLR